MSRTRSVMVLAFFLLLLSWQAIAQKPPSAKKDFALWKFDEAQAMCRAKGRLQDLEYCRSKMMDAIVANGKASIPILISHLTDERQTKQPIYDFWHETTAGDVAYFILQDLFTDDTWTHTTMDLHWPKEDCDQDGETCWQRFIKKHGRRHVQAKWQAAWNANKDRIYWDDKARCFRVSPAPTR